MLAVYDIEIFCNFMQVCFYLPQSDTYKDFVYTENSNDTSDLQNLMDSITTLIGFNNHYYDNILLQQFLTHGNVAAIKKLSNDIIENKVERIPVYLKEQDYDVLQILDRRGSLKEYQARMGLEKIVDYSGDFEAPLPEEEIPEVMQYCHYDCWSTYKLWAEKITQEKFQEKLALCQNYQLGNPCFTREVLVEKFFEKAIIEKTGSRSWQHLKNPRMRATGKQIIDKDVFFTTYELLFLLDKIKDHEFIYEKNENDRYQWQNKFYKNLKLTNWDLSFATTTFRLSGEKKSLCNPQHGKLLLLDIPNYYPGIIDKLGIAPQGLEQAFQAEYKDLYQQSLALEESHSEDAVLGSLKLLLNNVYAKFKDKNSCLFDPICQLQISLNGQLFLLNLIELLLRHQIEVLHNRSKSLCVYITEKQQPQLQKCIEEWQKYTGFTIVTEELQGILVCDEECYAWLQEGKILREKGKGFRTDLSLFYSGLTPFVCGIAVRDYFAMETPVKETIEKYFREKDWQKFVLWTSRKGETGRKQVIRYVLSKTGEKPDNLETWGGHMQLVKDAQMLDWDILDIQRYNKIAQDTIDLVLQNFDDQS